MARYHLRFKNLHPNIIEVTETLFKSRPWRGTQGERHEKFSRWLREAAVVYGVPEPTFQVRRGMRTPPGTYAPNRITLSHYSVVTLFHEFRHHLQWHDEAAVFEPEEDAKGWSCSLFYTVRPHLFRKAVREGRIYGVSPEDLLKKETIRSNRKAVLEQCLRNWCIQLIDEGLEGSEVAEKNEIVKRYIEWYASFDFGSFEEGHVERYVNVSGREDYRDTLKQFVECALLDNDEADEGAEI